MTSSAPSMDADLAQIEPTPKIPEKGIVTPEKPPYNPCLDGWVDFRTVVDDPYCVLFHHIGSVMS